MNSAKVMSLVNLHVKQEMVVCGEVLKMENKMIKHIHLYILLNMLVSKILGSMNGESMNQQLDISQQLSLKMQWVLKLKLMSLVEVRCSQLKDLLQKSRIGQRSLPMRNGLINTCLNYVLAKPLMSIIKICHFKTGRHRHLHY